MDFQRTPLYVELSSVQLLKLSHFHHLHHIPTKKKKKEEREETLTLIIFSFGYCHYRHVISHFI